MGDELPTVSSPAVPRTRPARRRWIYVEFGGSSGGGADPREPPQWLLWLKLAVVVLGVGIALFRLGLEVGWWG